MALSILVQYLLFSGFHKISEQSAIMDALTGTVKFLETRVAKEVNFVKTVGETVGEGVINVGETVGKEALTVGGTVGKGALTVGETVGKSALTVGERVGKGALVVGETVGEGVVSVGETALDTVTFIDGSVNNIIKFIRMCQNFYSLACRYKKYLEDDSLIESTLALAVWLLICFYFQIWMVPVVLLILYVKNLISIYIFGDPAEDENALAQSCKTKVEAIGEILGLVRVIISTLETLLEKILGFVNIKSLHFHLIAIVLQVAITLVLMYMPINFLLMLWGISLYSKKFWKKKTPPGETPKNCGQDVVYATQELHGAVGDFVTLNFSKGYGLMKDAFGKLSSKCD